MTNKKDKKRHFSFRFQLGAYFASLVIGAGILSLPLSAVKIGFIPFLVCMFVCTLLFYYIYGRLMGLVYSLLKIKSEKYSGDIEEAYVSLGKDEEWKTETNENFLSEVCNERDQRLYDDVLDVSKGKSAGWRKRWGKISLVLGLSIYSITAIVAYLTVGTKSISKIVGEAEGLRSQPITVSLFIVLGLVLIFVSIYLMRVFTRKGWHVPKPESFDIALDENMFMGGIWLLGIGALIYAQLDRFWLEAIGMIIFVFSFSLARLISGRISDKLQKGGEKEEREKYKLLPTHKSNAIVTFLEMSLLIVAVILVCCALWQNANWQTLVAFDMKPGYIMDLFITFGVILFAFVGVSIFNIVVYGELFEASEASGGVKPNCVFVIFMFYLIFTAVVLLFVPEMELIAADMMGEYSLIPLSLQLPAGMIRSSVILLGYGFALIAVANACRGYLDTLSKRWEVSNSYWRSHFSKNKGRDSKELKEKTWIFWTAGLVMGFLLALISNFVIRTTFTTLIGFAGGIGSGLFLVAMPFLMEDDKFKYSKFKYFGLLGLTIFISVLAVIKQMGV